MENRAKPISLFPAKPGRFSRTLIFAAGFGLLLALAPSGAADEIAPPERPKRIVVKFKAPLAQEVESALPSSLDLDAPEQAVRPAWFHKHGVRKLAPLNRDMMRQKKGKGLTSQQLFTNVRSRFSRRGGRAPAGLASPDVTRTYVLEMSAVSDLDLDLAAAELQADPEVEFAQREQVVEVQLTPNDPYFPSTGSWGQSYADMWGLYRIQAPAAWDINHGQGIVVAVVDTGVDITHPDLTANVWTNTAEIPGNGIDDDQNGFIDDVNGWDFVGASYLNPVPDNDPKDVYGHGTHVAGTIAAVGNNGLGVVGVAWSARVMAVRGLDNSGTGSDAVLANAIIYAANNGADVINNSYGGEGFSQVLLDAVNYAHSLGVVVVVSAGNSNARAETFFPASSPNAITVAASTPTDGKSYYSNFGGKLDVAAPGDDILSLLATGNSLGSPIGGNYTRLSGTSMAAPHVAGLAALILSQQPALSAEQVRQIIRTSASDLGFSGFDIYFGWGRINAAAALAVSNPLEAKIQSPRESQLVNGPVTFSGVAQGPGFVSYALDYGATETPASWTSIQQGTISVNGGVLGTAELGLPDGRHAVRLQVYDNLGRVFADRMTLNVQYSQIASPRTPPVPSAAQEFKPGVPVVLQGTIRGPSFLDYRVEWARGLAPTGGWSSSGLSLTNGGATPVSNGTFATFATAGLTQADYYTIRVLVDNSGFTSETRTTIYLEPDLVSVDWPKLLLSTPADWLGNWSGPVPARNATGGIGLFLSVGPDSITPANAKLLGFAPDGAATEEILLQTATASFQPAAADLDGSPGDEIIVGDGGTVRVVRPDRSAYVLTPAETVSFKNSQIIVEDLNNDGVPEIIALGNGSSATNKGSAFLYAWKPNGQLLSANYPIQVANANEFQRDYAPGRFLAVDLNGDGLKEILVAESTTISSCTLRAYKWDGTPYAWPAQMFANHIKTMVAGDMDKDGQMDIAISYMDSIAQEYWAVLSADGSLKPGWPQTPTYGTSGSRLALADLNRDGRRQLVVTSSGHQIYVFNVDGTSYAPAWPMYNLNPNCIAIADIDGDGFPEIVTQRLDWVLPPGGAGYDEYKLVAYSRAGAVVRSWKYSGRNGFASTRDMVPAIGDFRLTGNLDFALWYRLSSYGFGEAMVLSSGTTYSPANADWPLAYHDARNTAVVSITGSGAPAVRLTSPTDGSYLVGIVTVSASASDDVGVSGVQFKLDGTNLGAELTAVPYSVSWDTRPAASGLHVLSAVARDGEGKIATSAITVTVNNDATAPVVAFSSPADGSTVTGVVNLAATATDNVGVAGVQFKVDGVNFGAEDTVAPYSTSWDVQSVANGSHTLVAVARDAVGNQTVATITVTVNNDSTVPVVAFSSPTNGSTVTGTVNLAATATDNVGVAGVQFKVDGVNFGAEDTAAPYSTSWNVQSVANGSHTLAAVARDAAGNQTTATITVTVNNDLTAPVVAFSSPANGSTVTGTVNVAATATDNVGVVGVQFKLDGILLDGEDTVAPYSISWNVQSFANGSHTLGAVARDAAGNQATATITVTVNNDVTAPTVTLSSPTNGSTVTGTIAVAATATDNVGVAGVQFKVDGVNVGAEDTSSPYTINWDTRTATNASHTVTAVARDTSGNLKTSAANTVTVRNDLTAPTVAFSSPANGGMVTGTINLTATATDNTAVVGVQFRLDGANLGAEDTSSPYTVSWDTRTTTNGSHTLAAVARDAAGNQATANITVTANNDLTAPVVTLGSPANGSTVAGTVSLAATATDNVAVAGVQFKVDGVNVGAEDTSSPYTASWNTITFTNASHAVTAVARDTAGNLKTSAASTVTVRNVIKINFQPASAPTFAGYAVDSGQTFGVRTNGYSYGWNANNTANAFDRNSSQSADQRYDTLITMQTGGTFTWEIGVPNGSYSVHVVAGDASNTNSVYKINVEGALTVNGTPSGSARWKEGTVTVTVSDGRLTVSNASGASNNKICFLEITPVP